jgi:putative ABC transport system ATP-binding protein
VSIFSGRSVRWGRRAKQGSASRDPESAATPWIPDTLRVSPNPTNGPQTVAEPAAAPTTLATDATAPATPAPNVPAVSCERVVKRYGEGDAVVLALRGVTLQFATGSFTAIMGPSGSGKSTLMHILAGLDTPTEGSVEIAGRRLDEMGDRELTQLRRDSIGFVFQAFNLLPVLTAEENIVLPLTIAGKKPDPYWLQRLLQTFDLADRRDHRPSELSGGQQQRTAIARALITRPSVVFADEPTGNLDSAASTEVLAMLRRAVDEFGQTIVMVTHDSVAAAHADRILFLDDGQVVRDSPKLSAAAILDALKVR